MANEEGDMQQRFAAVCAVMATTQFQEQLTNNWRNQKDNLRQTLVHLLSVNNSTAEQGVVSFGEWWESTQQLTGGEEIRLAVVLAALEDLMNDFANNNTHLVALLHVVCPELMQPQLLATEQQQSAGKTERSGLVRLLHHLVLGTENNDGQCVDFPMEEHFGSTSATSRVVKEALCIARSCLLLQFAVSVILLHQQQDEE
jgi:hypothetical protein